MFHLLASATLLTSCGATVSSPPPVVITPDVVPYSQEFQAQLADELEAEHRPTCPPDILVPNCVAWVRAVADYGRMREQARAAKGE